MVNKLKMMAMVLVGLAFFTLGHPVLAQEREQESVVTPQAYRFLLDTSCLHTLDGTNIGVSGTTHTYSAVDKITTTTYLEKKTSSSWTVVKSWTNSTYNSSYCDVDSSYTGVSGTTYRVRCYHQAYEGNIVETNTSYSDIFNVK